MAATISTASEEMLHRIFRHFDEDGDGGLDRREMAALVLALNPSINFTREQIGGVVDQVFRFYSKADCVTLAALLCIYDDIAGDVHDDFDALFLRHDHLLLPRHDHSSSASPEMMHAAEPQEEEEDVGNYLPAIPDEPCLVSSSEDPSSESDYDGCAWPLDVSPSFRWLLSRGVDGDGRDRLLSKDTTTSQVMQNNETVRFCAFSSRDSSPLNSEDESSESDYGGGPPPLGTGEMPSLRWMLGTSDRASSLASSSLATSEAESSDCDVGGYPPQAEVEEIPSPTFRWPSSTPASPLQMGVWYSPPPTTEDVTRDHERGGGTSSEDESSESDYGGGPPPLGTGEMPSLRWMLGTSDRASSLASSSLSTSEADSSDCDVGWYPPQAEVEEIPSPTFRWPSSTPASPPLQMGVWSGGTSSSLSWAGIRKLGTLSRFRYLRWKS